MLNLVGDKMSDEEIKKMLQDLIKINSVIATELIQLVENSSKQFRGEISDSCKHQHLELKKEIIEIADKWNTNCKLLKKHNFGHE